MRRRGEDSGGLRRNASLVQQGELACCEGGQGTITGGTREGRGGCRSQTWLDDSSYVGLFFYIKIYLNGKKNNNNNKITRKEITRKHTSVCLWRESRKTKNKRKR